MTPLDWFNCGLGLLIVLVGLGAIDRMSRQTECTIIAAFITTVVGAAGYALGSLVPVHWQKVFDTLLLGGVAAVLIGTRRQTVWLSPTWMPRLSLAVSLGSWALFFSLVS